MNFMSEINEDNHKHPREGGQEGPREGRGRGITPRQKPSREERGGGELTMISLVLRFQSPGV